MFTYQQWNIGVIEAPISELLKPNRRHTIRWLPRPQWPFCIADPFPLMFGGEKFVMSELYDFRTGRGAISALKLRDDYTVEASVPALTLPFHMSYPCMIETEGSLFCSPETLATNDLSIYKCERFPDLWSKYATVQAGQPFADPTVFCVEGRWWLFATKYDAATGGNSELHAWFADSLHGPWRPHALAPLKNDRGSSRSAGTPFFHEGRLFRPAQNCSTSYGGSVVINEILKLTPEEFQEKIVAEILPDSSYPHAFHHIAKFGDTILVDGRRDIFFPAAARVKLSRWLSERRGNDPEPAPVRISWEKRGELGALKVIGQKI